PGRTGGRWGAGLAGALGVGLGGTNVYHGRPERRGPLGEGPVPGPADLDRAIRLSRLVAFAATVLCSAAAYLLGGRDRARGTRDPGPTRAAPMPGRAGGAGRKAGLAVAG